MLVKKTYGELNPNDVIFFHGALLILVDVWCYEANDGKTVIRFKTKPYNYQAINILGEFYANGTYGGISSLQIECYVKDDETDYKYIKTHMSSMYGNIKGE